VDAVQRRIGEPPICAATSLGPVRASRPRGTERLFDLAIVWREMTKGTRSLRCLAYGYTRSPRAEPLFPASLLSCSSTRCAACAYPRLPRSATWPPPVLGSDCGDFDSETACLASSSDLSRAIDPCARPLIRCSRGCIRGTNDT
jgi:hypothetical protein